jgi:hypothetical protein
LNQVAAIETARRVTISAIARTSPYVAKRKAPYLPAELSCMRGIKVEKLESRIA